MGTVAIMAGGALLNAFAVIGGNYLAKYLSRNDPDAAEKEKERHDRALEAYQAAWQKYTQERNKMLDWIAENERIKEQAQENFTETDEAFKLYNRAHPDAKITNPVPQIFPIFTPPASCRKPASFFLSEPAPLRSGGSVTIFF